MKNRAIRLSRLQKQLIAASMDFVFLPILFYFALLLHFDAIQPAGASEFRWLALLAPTFAIPIFVTIGLYRAVIRYIDQKIITTVLSGTTLSTILLAEASHFMVGDRLSITPFLIYWSLAILYVLASRFAARGYFVTARNNSQTRVAIYGAGEGGNRLARALILGTEYSPVFFIDDNPQLRDTTIGGLRVYAARSLTRLARLHGVDTVLLAMPSLSRSRQREIIDRLVQQNFQVKVVPPVANLIQGLAKVDQVRTVDIEDLLGRDTVSPDSALLGICIQEKNVMVSGAGGSIGSELCRQILNLKPVRLVLFERSEFALYRIEQELREHCDTHRLTTEIIPLIGSVSDFDKCRRVLATFNIDTVYHAAAYKHVPLVEHNPIDGIRNNVFGTLQFARAAMACQVQHFVLVSTDKAVRPTNVMGATKRIAELVLQAFARQNSKTCFSMVRFGNVLGSSGSVVPLFRKQIAAGGPVTITHPEITRYFMTIPEAAQLVIQAGAMAQGGDVFVLDMGEPVRIADLAKRMIHLSGHSVKVRGEQSAGIEIRYVGLRPGEKLYEELLIGGDVSGTAHPLIMRTKEMEIDWPFLELSLKHLQEACDRFDHLAIRDQLQRIVPEYRPDSGITDLVWSEFISNQANETYEAASHPVEASIIRMPSNELGANNEHSAFQA